MYIQFIFFLELHNKASCLFNILKKESPSTSVEKCILKKNETQQEVLLSAPS